MAMLYVLQVNALPTGQQAAAHQAWDITPFLLLLLLPALTAVLLVLQVRVPGPGSSPATHQAFRSSSCSLLA